MKLKPLIIIILALIPFSSFPENAGTIKVGVISNVTGENSTDIVSAPLAIKMAADEINQKGGISGKKIEIIVYNNEGTSVGSKIAAERAVKDGVVAVLGFHYSFAALAAAPVLQKNGIPLIADTATNPAVTLAGDYIFRVCFTDEYQGQMIARIAREKLKASKITAIIDTDSRYSIDLTEITLDNFKKRGGRVGHVFKIKNDRQEFSEITDTLKKSDSDVILVTSYTIQAALIIKSIRKAGIKASLIGGDSWSYRITNYTGELGGKNYFITGWSETLTDKNTKKFINNFRKRHPDTSITQSAGFCYDSMNLLADAIRRAGSTDRKQIRDALAGTKNFSGITGKMSFDENRNPRKPAIINRISGRKIISEYFY